MAVLLSAFVGCVLQSLCSSPFFMPFTRKLPSISFTRMYVIDYVTWVTTTGGTLYWAELECPKPPKRPFSPYKFVWCSILATIASWSVHELH